MSPYRKSRGNSVTRRALLPTTLALVLVAGAVPAQVIMRPPGQPRPAPSGSQQEQVPRPPGTTDPDGPYTLALRVYVTPADPTRVLPPGRGVQLFLIDPDGRRFGRASEGHAVFLEIPDATYESVVNPAPNAPVGPRGRAGVGIALRRPKEGRYELQVIGTERAGIEYVLLAFDRTGRQRWTHFGRGATEPGTVDRYEVTYSLSLDPPVWIAEKPDRAYLSVHVWGESGQDQDVVTDQLLTDPRGRRLGYSQPTRTPYSELPRSSYVKEGGQTRPTAEIEILAPATGTHTLEVVGTHTGRYDFEISYWDGEGEGDRADFEGIPTAPGVVHRYTLECARGPKPVVRLSGALRAGTLLSFASPIGAATQVSRTQAAFPVVVFYGETILPSSFRVTLNGADVGKRFHPKPDGHEVVTLQLKTGKNELVVSAQGRAGAGGAPAISTRFEIEVR